MTKKIELRGTAQAHEGSNKAGRSDRLMSKSINSPVLNRLNDELIRGFDESNVLESLPQEIVVHILTKLRHCDLKHTLLVSKLINEAAIVARESHFLFSTPSKKPVFRSGSELTDSEAPNAPKASKQRRARQQRARGARINDKRLRSLRVVLFGSPERSWTTAENSARCPPACMLRREIRSISLPSSPLGRRSRLSPARPTRWPLGYMGETAPPTMMMPLCSLSPMRVRRLNSASSSSLI
ncbi:F-box protein [Platanthera guangdongensis]|uniref:F-box protein n=1 Tax=Platanthera guangdongensis TaxID=2320717 RepID=A0ABR2MCQ7_9ASPA